MSRKKIVIRMINGDKISCTEDKGSVSELLRMMEGYPHHFIDIKEFFKTPGNKSIYIKGETVCSVGEDEEKEVLAE